MEWRERSGLSSLVATSGGDPRIAGALPSSHRSLRIRIPPGGAGEAAFAGSAFHGPEVAQAARAGDALWGKLWI